MTASESDGAGDALEEGLEDAAEDGVDMAPLEDLPPTLRPGPGLHVVATPIGHARDITLRALDVLRGADTILAEDTRRTRQLLAIHGIPLGPRRMIAYNDRNGAERRPGILARLAAGEAVALVSDAGTPLIADPGHKLVTEAIAAGHRIFPVPGASAALAALTIAGLPTDRFLFAGFPPVKSAARRRFLAGFVGGKFSVILYESPRRAAVSVADMAATLGSERPAALCRELTKTFEETRRGTLGGLARALAEGPPPKGEIVIVIGPEPDAPSPPAESRAEDLLRAALLTLSVRDAARQVADLTGLPRKDLYERALRLAAGGHT